MTDTIQNSKQSSSLNDKDPCDGLEEEENPLDPYRFNSQETMFVPTTFSEEISIAPGEGKQPTSMLSGDYCKELAFPYLFPEGKFGYKSIKELKLSPVKYFNQRLLNYTQIFASDSNYIFYALPVTQELKLNSEINIALRKVFNGTVTAGMLSQSVVETVQSFVGKDKAYRFINTIKGTPAYWKKFLYEVLAMVKQLGLPIVFITLSCADLQWNELLLINAELRGELLSEDSINEMDFFKRCRYLNLNPVSLARHFQYRVEAFFKVIVLNDPFVTVKYHAIRVEFQVRGSPRIHSFIWIVDAPILTKDNIGEYVAFIDSVVKLYVRDPIKNPDFFKLVTTYQVHSHSKSCRKYKNEKCRHHFEKFFTDHTIISIPLDSNLPEDVRSNILNERDRILGNVKEYIDNNLNPKQRNILNSLKKNYEKVPNIPDILKELNLTEDQYYDALSISNDSGFQNLFKAPAKCMFY